MPLPVTSASGRVVLITGANRGIGLATARELQKRGAKVVAGVRDPKRMPAVAGAAVIDLDVSDRESCRAFVARAEAIEGRIDGFINNAGILIDSNTSALELREEDLRRVLDINLIGSILLCQLVVSGMLKRGYGRVVNVSSGLGSISSMGAGYPAYRLSKLALNGFTRVLAAELGPNVDVKVNSISPGWVRTDMGGSGASRDPSDAAHEIADLVSLAANGPSGGFFYKGEPADW
jgi:NAD(P)-dependent dehydrogenase (short-subunit alcohol dehydrogenase family)